MIKTFVIGLVSLGLFNCSGSRNHADPHPTPIVVDTVYCSQAEAHMQDLCNQEPNKNAVCCQTAAPTLKKKSFTQVCTEVQNAGIFLNPKCLSTIITCDQIDICTGTKK